MLPDHQRRDVAERAERAAGVGRHDDVDEGQGDKPRVPLADGGSATFYLADFEKTTAAGTEAVRCRWAWAADGTWHAPDYPRLFFARSQVSRPVLYKLYVVHPLGDEDLTKSDPYRTLAADLATALGRHLAK